MKVNESEESLKLFKQMYEAGVPNKEIGDKFGIKPNTVCYWVKKLGLKMRGSGRKNKFSNPFEIQSPERDYWLGYIFADGHVQRGRIDLNSIDKEIIDAYQKFTGNICKIYTDSYETQSGEVHILYRAFIHSVDISEWFMKTFNIDPVKHHTLNPTIELNWDILRGYFDGDGSAHKIRGFTVNSSSITWITRISKFLEEQLNIIPKINQYLECYKLCVWNKEDLIKLVSKLYSNSTFCLERKKIKFEPFISNNNRKQDELLEVCDDNQQPSQPLTKLEGSETND